MTSARFTIYCHTNCVNGKRYVGQTVYSMEKRWGDHVANAKGIKIGSPVFTRAIRKHGADAFDHMVLEVVSTQEEADLAETRWIEQLVCRVPSGYNLKSGGGARGHVHDATKLLIGKASRTWWGKMTPKERHERQKGCWTPERTARAKLFQVSEKTRAKISEATAKRVREMTPEQLSKHIQNLRSNPEKRLARVREVNSTKEFGEKIRAGQKGFWAQLTPEEKSVRVRHQLAGMSGEEKSDRVRKAWEGMTPEAREARVRKATARSSATKSLPAHIKKMSEFQTAQAKLRTPEQRRAMVLKAWETRRAKHGQHGVKRVKTSEEYAESTKRGWASMTPEAHAERVRKTVEGRRVAREARRETRNSNLVRINLLRAP